MSITSKRKLKGISSSVDNGYRWVGVVQFLITLIDKDRFYTQIIRIPAPINPISSIFSNSNYQKYSQYFEGQLSRWLSRIRCEAFFRPTRKYDNRGSLATRLWHFCPPPKSKSHTRMQSQHTRKTFLITHTHLCTLSMIGILYLCTIFTRPLKGANDDIITTLLMMLLTCATRNRRQRPQPSSSVDPMYIFIYYSFCWSEGPFWKRRFVLLSSTVCVCAQDFPFSSVFASSKDVLSLSLLCLFLVIFWCCRWWRC